MTIADGEVEVRWLPGLGSSPGAVDLTMHGPAGPIARAVTLPEALTVCAVIDALCPAPSNLYVTVRQLATHQPTARWRP